ncbi:MAG TPA: GNAT family N-acetyltransferase [Acidimicrobiales bacterium]|nr:GNAT family N-acetyltransferase [Acidimicrobiales bacterium]
MRDDGSHAPPSPSKSGADDRIIGTSHFGRYDHTRDEVEIGWTFLARSHWGGPYNGEMKRLMLRHAFRSVDTVVFRVHSLNFRSQRAVVKLGAVGPARRSIRTDEERTTSSDSPGDRATR